MEKSPVKNCPFCPFTESDDQRLLRHYIKRHREEEGFQLLCKACYHPFTTCAGLVSHLRRNKHGCRKASGNVNDNNQSTSTEVVPTDETSHKGNANKDTGQRTSARGELEETIAEEDCQFVTLDIRNPECEDPGSSEGAESNWTHEPVLEVEDDGDSVHEGEGHTSPDSTETASENPLMWEGAKFLLHLREEGMVSHSAVDKAVDGVNDLFSKFSETIKAKLLNGVDKNGSIPQEHINDVFQEFSPGIFDGVDSKSKLDSFMQENCNVFTPIQVELGRTNATNSKGILIEVPHYAYVSPFLPSLKRFLSCPDVLDCILSARNPDDDVLRGYQDGSYAKEHPILKEDGTAGVILCYDELEISSPLGPAKHKLALYYWTLANLPPHMRSSLRSIGLLGIAWSKDLKPTQKKSRTTSPSFDLKYEAHCMILEDFLKGLKELEKGIEVTTTDKNVVTIRGTLLCVTGDSPAVGTLGGFKESVGPAHKPCHVCHGDHYEVKCIFDEDFFEKRIENSYHEQLDSVTDISKPLYVREYNSTLWGINGPSVISGLTDYNNLSCSVFDLMHICHEGVLEIHMRALLHHCVVENENYFTLDEINSKVNSLAMKCLVHDRPAGMKIEHLKSGLRQSAAQMFWLANILLFVLMKKTELRGRLLNFALLLKIIHGLLCFEVRRDDVGRLKAMIKQHHETFMVDYPNVEIVPKFHYMIHLPSQIALFGPARITWTMRFEAMHSYFKNIIRIIKNFKNPPWSMSYRYECLRACQMLSMPGEEASPFIETKDVSYVCKLVKMSDYCWNSLVALYFGETASVLTCGRVRSKNVYFSRGSYILISEAEPVFGKINDIVICDKMTLLIVEILKTVSYLPLCNAFKVSAAHPSTKVVLLENLNHHQTLPCITFPDDACMYLIVQYTRLSAYYGSE